MGDWDKTRTGEGVALSWGESNPSSAAENARENVRALLTPAFEAASAIKDNKKDDRPILSTISVREVRDGPREEDGHIMKIELDYDNARFTNALKIRDARFPVLLEHAINSQLDGSHQITAIAQDTKPGHIVFSFPGTLQELVGANTSITTARAQAIADVISNKKHILQSLPVLQTGRVER